MVEKCGGRAVKRSILLLILLTLPALGQGASPELLEHWKYDKSAPLNVKQAGVQERQGIKIYDITYSAPVGDRGAVIGPNGGIVSAYLVVPSGKGPHPAVIYGHWCMPGSEKKNRTEFLDEALVLARSGVVSLLPDHVTVRPDFPQPPKDPLDEAQFGLGVQQVINLMRGADLLLARKDVDPARLAYVGHSCNAQAGGYLSGIDKRFKAFVLMAGDLADEVDLKTKPFQDFRQKIGAERFDAFVAQHSWSDTGKYVSHAAPAFVFLQYATNEPFLNAELARQYAAVVSEPKKLKIYDAEHALNAEATRDRVAFLAQQLAFHAPGTKAVAAIPVLVQPPWPKQQ
jgi:dienelactone hydrolase